MKYAKGWIALAGGVASVAASIYLPGMSPEMVQGLIGLVTAGAVYQVPND